MQPSVEQGWGGVEMEDAKKTVRETKKVPVLIDYWFALVCEFAELDCFFTNASGNESISGVGFSVYILFVICHINPRSL